MPQPSPVTSETELFFTEGGNGVPPTFPGPDWFNIIQSELINILRAAGLDPDKMDNTQILAALKKLFLSRSNPFGDIKADGAAAIATALSNLRLGAGAPAIGIPFFWPSVAMPNTVMDEWSDMVFLKFNGATFSATTYPKLALVIPSLKLTDARGAFPRILDDGRGVDNGRVLLSEQLDAMQNVTGSLSDNTMGSASSASGVFMVDSGSGVKYAAPSVGNAFGYYGLTFDLSRSGRTSEETRPRNIAFNFLVRAK
ncbi:integrase [Citrobacter freundii]|uniref:integrase n=1 Tax=Citrobacter freundii TaxID=546 RepID=UPI00374ED057